MSRPTVLGIALSVLLCSAFGATCGVPPEGLPCGGCGSDCPEGWIQNPANGHCYKATSRGTWAEAHAEAVSLGGHLVTINDIDENRWVFSTFASLLDRPVELAWIGLYQDTEDPAYSEPDGAWKWTSGEDSDYRNWSGDEPNNWRDEQSALMSSADGRWRDTDLLGGSDVGKTVNPPGIVEMVP